LSVHLLDELHQADVVAADESGRRFVVGPWRAMLDEDAILVARERLDAPIERAERCDEGWVFLTRAGTVAYADDFLETPRAVASLIPDRWSLSVSGGRAIVLGEGGLALGARCGAPLAALQPVVGETVDAIWAGSDAWFAHAGGLAYTSSDGQTWTHDDMPLNAPRAPDRERASDALAERVRAALARTHVDAAHGRRTAFTTRIPLEDGRTLLHGYNLPIRIVSNDGTLTAAPWSEDRGCQRIRAWGSRVVAQCPGDDGTRWMEVDGATLRPIAGWLGSEPVFLPDGQRALFHGPCDEGADDRRTLCLHDAREGRAAPIEVGLDGPSPMAADAQRVVLFDGRMHVWEPGPPARLVTLEGEREAWAPALMAEIGPELSDGIVWGFVVRDRALVPFVAEAPDYAIRIVELPEGALAFGVARADLAITVGDHLGEIWASSDGARSFERVRADVDGDASGVRFLERSPYRGWPAMTCDAEGCEVRGVVRVARGPAGARIAAAPERPPMPVDEGRAALPTFRFACSRSTTEPTRWPRQHPEESTTGLVAHRSAGPGARVEIERRRQQLRFRWAGEDREGTWSAESRWLERAALHQPYEPTGNPLIDGLPMLHPRTDAEEPRDDAPLDCAAHLVQRTSLLVHCGQRWLWIARGGGARTLALGPSIRDVMVFTRSIALMDHALGGARVLQLGHDGTPLDVALVRDEPELRVGLFDGDVVALRPLPRMPTLDRMRASFVFLRDEPSERVPLPEDALLPGCRGQSAQWIVPARGEVEVDGERLRGSNDDRVDAFLIGHEGGWCIQEVASFAEGEPHRRGYLLRASAGSDGRLVGVFDDANRRSAIECRVVSAIAE
jgi:hypothetical protein